MFFIVLFSFSFFVVPQALAETKYLCKCVNGQSATVSSFQDCLDLCENATGGGIAGYTEIKTGGTDGKEVKAGGTSASASTDTPKLENPLGEDNPSIPELIGRIIKAILGVVGSIALAMFVYGGFLWMTSSGNTEMVQKGKDTLIWATIGLVAIFAAYALVHFIIQKAVLGNA